MFIDKKNEFKDQIYDIVPENFIEKESLVQILELFFSILEKNCEINDDFVGYYSAKNTELIDDLYKIYLQDFYSTYNKIKNTIRFFKYDDIPLENLNNYCISSDNIIEHIYEYFDNEQSTGLNVLNENEYFIVQSFNDGTSTEFNKKFVMQDTSHIDSNTTVLDAYNQGYIRAVSICCSDVDCLITTLPQCNDININNYIATYTGGNLAQDILDDMPGVVTDCENLEHDFINRSPYVIGSQFLYTNNYINDHYVNERLLLKNLINMEKVLTDETIWSSKDFKQNKGRAKSFYYIYNLLKDEIINDDIYKKYGIEYVKVLEKRDENGNLIPFEYNVKSLINIDLYKKLIKPVVHPVGFSDSYTKEIAFKLTDYLCSEYTLNFDSIFLYDIREDKHYDIREGNGIFGYTGSGQDLNYDVEIDDYVEIPFYNQKYISILMSNGYRYIKEYNKPIKLYDNLNNLIRVYNESIDFVRVTSSIQHGDEFLNIVDNTRSEGNTLDHGNPSESVYRVEFRGNFLTNEDTVIYLRDALNQCTVKYFSTQGKLNLYYSNNDLKYSFNEDYKLVFNKTEKYTIKPICKDIETVEKTIYLQEPGFYNHYLIVQENDANDHSSLQSTELDTTHYPDYTEEMEKSYEEMYEIDFTSHPDMAQIGTYAFKVITNTDTFIFSYNVNESMFISKVLYKLYYNYIDERIDEKSGIHISLKDKKLYLATTQNRSGESSYFKIEFDSSNTVNTSNISINEIQQAHEEKQLVDYIQEYYVSNGNYDGLGDTILASHSPNFVYGKNSGLDNNYNGMRDFDEFGYQDIGFKIGTDLYGNLPDEYDVGDVNTYVANYTGSYLSHDILIWFYDIRNFEPRQTAAFNNIVYDKDVFYMYDRFRFL